MTDLHVIRGILEDLAGQPAPLPEPPTDSIQVFEGGADSLGYSQLNELLLLFGFDRVTHAFFCFLLRGSIECDHGGGFSSLEALRDGVQRFRKIAILTYGNVKYAFKMLSTDPDQLKVDLEENTPLEEAQFKRRHCPIFPVAPISPDEAYLTGYLVEKELQQRLEQDPTDQSALDLENRRKVVVDSAFRNHQAYLASDHLDVYVATSMRERHEFLAVSRLTRDIFEDEALKDLNLRWFDPTQAWCPNRIDKGLSEALMLRRASCTIYLAQEVDTLGKDSELASTLAQGKPVIAFVPEVTEAFLSDHLELVKAGAPEKEEVAILLDQLRLFDSAAAWSDPEVRDWCASPEDVDLSVLRERVKEKIRSHYDRRASTLRDSHPLGIQVNLGTGVANGVLVVRRIGDCARLVRGIVTRTLDFDLEESAESTLLRETISGCIFRVVTSDEMLTNTFWNFYLDPAV